MGRPRKLPSGFVAFPIDIGDRSAERAQFYRLLLRPSERLDALLLTVDKTVSVACFVKDDALAREIVAGAAAVLQRADAAMYAAKQAGRCRLQIA